MLYEQLEAFGGYEDKSWTQSRECEGAKEKKGMAAGWAGLLIDPQATRWEEGGSLDTDNHHVRRRAHYAASMPMTGAPRRS
jgi:hypothetical protein